MSDSRKKDIIEELYSSEIPFSVIGNQIHTELFSNRRLSIDGRFSVAEYTDELITLKLKKGILQITGSDLCINSVDTDRICITGEIISLEFCY